MKGTNEGKREGKIKKSLNEREREYIEDACGRE